MRHLLPLQTQKSPFPVARTSSESGIDVTAEHHFEKSFDHSSTSLYHPHHKKFRVCFPPPTFAPVITKQVVAGVSFLPSFFDLMIQNHYNNTLHYSLSSSTTFPVIQSEAKNLECIAQPFQCMYPRSFTALRSVLDDNSERGNKNQENKIINPLIL